MENPEEKMAVTKAETPAPVENKLTEPTPFFVEAEKLFEKFGQISRETALKAYDFFRARGGELGKEIDDWFNAEAQLLRFVPVRIADKDGMLSITADVAGFKPEDIEISVDDKVLMISGETKKTQEHKNESIIYSDFESNRFFRRLTLPSPVNTDKAKAEVKDGILNISFPKIEEAKPKQIAVSAG